MFLKDPDAVLDYRLEWADTLAEGGAIVASEWAVEPVETGGVGIVAQALDGGVAVVTLVGGLRGHVYRARNRVTFADGIIDERSILVRVEER